MVHCDFPKHDDEAKLDALNPEVESLFLGPKNRFTTL